jgi:hypothetical protein
LIKNNRVAIHQNASQLVKIARVPTGANNNVPELQYAHFTGNPKEMKSFIYFIRKKLQEKGHCFSSKKSNINWIVCHFCHPNGNLGENVPSYDWWMAISFENNRSQNIPTESASVEDPYVLKVLTLAKAFLAYLEEVFNNKHEVDEAKKRLFAFKQGI